MKRYSSEIQAFIAANVEGRTCKELVELTNRKMGTNFTESSMKSYKTNHKLKSGTKCGNLPGVSKLFPKEIQEFIKTNAEDRGNTELTMLVNEYFKTQYTTKQIKTYKHNRHISSGLDGRFQPGTIPPNKGKKMPEELYKKCAPTMFKKGNLPTNYMPVGSEKRDSKDQFIYVKIADPNVWKQKHHILWEQHNGKVPKGHNVVFLDGNRENIVIENLALVSDAELLELNRSKLKSKYPEITKAGITIAKTKCAIRKRKKDIKQNIKDGKNA